ncbi:proline--tRNA ligase [Candidatus Gottesmanbacteria bacterium]|nr:proline--tRNA ligase [Candidatus Gottesmanbacteria bacterium]
MKQFDKKEIAKKSQDFDRWYTDVILKAEMADYSPVKGCMIIRPYGYEIWEKIQDYLDDRFKELGVKNAYFPLFIPHRRTTEFLWQEGHTAHATFEDADNFARKILKIYAKFDEEILAIPVITGKKSQSERFPGAAITYSLESLMPDGKVIQMGTSHHLGDNFAKVFDIKYLDKEGKQQYVWQTSWAETTRVIGALILSHGDDQGLILPPKIASIQVVIVPIKITSKVKKYSEELKILLNKQGFRVQVDDREEKTVGWKFNEWELKGVPLRIELGEREIDANEMTVVRRDTGEKIKVSRTKLVSEMKKLLDEIQINIFGRMKKFREENTHKIENYVEFKEIMKTKKGLIYTFWCEDPVCEAKIKEETKATSRVLPLDAKEDKGECIYCGKASTHRWYFAQAY